MAKLDNFLRYAMSMGASDLHISPDHNPCIRVHGELRKMKSNPLTPKETLEIIGEILSQQQKEAFSRDLELDFCYEHPEIGRFRANILKQREGVGAAFRLIPSKILTLDDLGFPATLKTMTQWHQGLVLVTGTTGNGKSTTLAAMIDFINSSRKVHIITIEDPIEFVHHNKLANITQREVKRHTESFATALRAALREDPDVILVGEMRDLETISLAITAAETGHLVLGTLHTRTAAKTVDRIIDVFPPDQQNQIRTMLAESLRGVISQQLVPRVDGRGRVLSYEVMIGNSAITNLIREGKTFQIPSLMVMGAREGMVLMEQNLAKLANTKIIAFEEALARAENKKMIVKRVVSYDSYWQGSTQPEKA